MPLNVDDRENAMSIMQSNDGLKAPLRRNARTEVTRQSLISAAERLIAEKGLANVSTRDVLAAAGQRNQSALQYHFGGKDGLIRAVVIARSEAMDNRRKELLSALPDTPSVKELATVLIRPLAELASDVAGGGRQHLIFLGQAVTRPGFELERAIDGYQQENFDLAARLIFDQTSELDVSERRLRLDMVLDVAIVTLKRWAATDCSGRTEDDIVDFLSSIAAFILSEPA